MTIKTKALPQKEREHWHHLLDSTVWNEFVYRQGDIVICAYSKSGTTWVQQIVAQLIWNGAEDLNVPELSPWLDCRFPAREERLQHYKAQTHRRFVKSHLPVDTMVLSPQAKYIYIGRDGRDVLWSLHNHHRKFKKDVVRDIDSVPERTGPPLGIAPESVTQYFQDWLAKDGYPWWPFWEHILSWWQLRSLPNVRLFHFSNLKRDMPAEIRRMAAFLEIPIDAAIWEAVLGHCSFDYMKAHAARSVPFGGDIFEGGAEAFMHKGTNGRWRDILTPQEVWQYEALAVEKLGEDCANWLATGELCDQGNT
ncbi:MAG: sulfotransferase domain-containing protein [Anaerolineales bacterium]|nr:sulfotransferase domain-containing protein [Anaerolineales bacterium]